MNFWFIFEYYDFFKIRYQLNFSYFVLSCLSSLKFVDVLDIGMKDFQSFWIDFKIFGYCGFNVIVFMKCDIKFVI